MYITTLWSCLPPPPPTLLPLCPTILLHWDPLAPQPPACNVSPLLDITTECTQTTPQLIIKCNSNWTVEHRWKQGNVPYTVFHSLHQPTTAGCPFKLSSTLLLIRLSVLSTCLHPSSPNAADEGRLRAKAQIPPASYSLTYPSLSVTYSLYLSLYNSKLISFHLSPG